MRRGRWPALLAVLLLGGAVPSATADSGCSVQQALNGGTPPTVYGVQIATINSTSVKVTSTIDPGNAPTSYSFAYGTYATGPTTRGTSGSLDGCSGQVAVSTTITGLRPSSNYEVKLTATNQYGSNFGDNDFSTPFPPPPPPDVSEHPLVLLTTHSTDVTIDTPITIRVRLLGRFQTALQNENAPRLKLSYAYPPYRIWHLSAEQQPTSGGRLSLPLYTRPQSEITPDENMRVRAEIGTSTSNTLTIYVEPQISFNISRADGGFSPNLIGLYQVQTYLTHRPYPRTVIYLYRAASSRGPFTRVAAGRLRPFTSGIYGPALGVRFVVRDPGRHDYLTCTPRPILSAMGRPFSFRACGRSRIR